MTVDLVLSSGFLAFARQAGFLQAVEDAGLEVDGVCGTSSGALAGALWAAGMSAAEIAAECSSRAPIAWMRPNLAVWRGLFTTGPALERLRALLPPTFQDLNRPFGVGVIDEAGRSLVLTSGPLPEAVAASCAIPWVFAPVTVGGGLYRDGGVGDRTGLRTWLARRETQALVHLVAASGGGQAPGMSLAWAVARTPKSGASFFGLGDFNG